MTIKPEKQAGFLSRWSQRKLVQKQSAPLEEADSELPADNDDLEASTDTEKESESLPLWQRQDIDPETKKQALQALFRQPEFNQRDGLNEYDDDFTSFSSLGDIVTHEMKRMLALAESLEQNSSEEPSVEQDKQSSDQPQVDTTDDNEDEQLA